MSIKIASTFPFKINDCALLDILDICMLTSMLLRMLHKSLLVIKYSEQP